MSTPPPRVREALQEMDDTGWDRREMSLRRERKSLKTTLMKDAWRESEHHTLDDPGTVMQWYDRNRNLLVIDLDHEPDTA